MASQASFRSRLWQGFKGIWRYYRGWKWLILIGMSVMLVMSTYLVFIAKTTNVAMLQDALKTVTTIYDKNDQEAGTLSAQKGTYINLDQMSTTIREAVVATEDKRFYQHNGFDAQGIGRALVRFVINRNTSGGGGSTLTQQLVKNAFLTLDQTLQRKLKEFFLALEVEKQFSKDQILEMYLNHAYFGNGVWGVEDASQRYFGHSAASLSWNEAAVLTGILKGPSLFNPIDDYEAAIERRNVVVGLLEQELVIDSQTAQSIKSSGIELHDAYVAKEQDQYPAYFDAVLDEAVAETGIPEADLLAKGYKIYTYLNPEYQNALDSAYQVQGIFPDDNTGTPLVQSASVVVEPSTGGVMAIYGGRGDYVHRGFNRATDMRRSPGSTIKPLAVYEPALEAGYKINSQVPDQVRAYGNNHYAPENYDRQTDPSGQVPLYYALAQSKNTSAVYLMDQLGIGKSVQKLDQFGLKIQAQDQQLTLALGALSQGVSPLQMASAYAAFANKGIRNDSYLIRQIKDASGHIIYQNTRPTKYMVMTPRVAADMTSMMLETYGGNGTGYGAGPSFGQIAGKTGSTEVSDGNMATRDKWMIGYTPDFVIASWVGLDKSGEQSLDDLMPNGMRQLFSIQTTNLMSASPQTSFGLEMASQMTTDTNPIADAVQHYNVGETIDQGAKWVNQNAGNLWDDIVFTTKEAVRGVGDWWRSIDWPF